jgi:M6 family metalloprotease-like protein
VFKLFQSLSESPRVPFTPKDFGYGPKVGSGNPGNYVNGILGLTESLIDYSQYDAVYFLVPKQMPYEEMGWGPANTHPYWISNGYITNGATGGADIYLNEQLDVVGAQWKWMTDETGYAFGLYDEDLDHASTTLGSWSVMANSWTNGAIEHNGWDRYLLGWLGASQVACLPKADLTAAGTSVTLNPLVRQNADIKVAVVPLSTSKILVMESRKIEGYDTMKASEQGVLVYTVDMTLGHLKGGYVTRPRPGAADRTWFTDAALHAGDAVTVEGVTVTVIALANGGDTIKISRP